MIDSCFYRNLRFAVLVIALLAMSMDPSSSGKARAHAASMEGRRRSLVCARHTPTPLINSYVPKSSFSTPARSRRKARKLSSFLPDVDDNSVSRSFTQHERGVLSFPRRTFPAAAQDVANSEDAFWLRNVCHHGFVVVKEKNRVLAQHEGLNKHNVEGKRKVFRVSVLFII